MLELSQGRWICVRVSVRCSRNVPDHVQGPELHLDVIADELVEGPVEEIAHDLFPTCSRSMIHSDWNSRESSERQG